jgi:hypothetical protein
MGEWWRSEAVSVLLLLDSHKLINYLELLPPHLLSSPLSSLSCHSIMSHQLQNTWVIWEQNNTVSEE